MTHTRLGLVLMYVAGAISGLLGIGSGIFKVLAMDLAMRAPLKVSTATSNFMIGVTAAAAPACISPGATSILSSRPPWLWRGAGRAVLGSRLLAKADNRLLRIAIIGILLTVALQMIWKGVVAG